LGVVITKVGNIIINKQRNLVDAKMKNALVKCFEEIKGLAPKLSNREIDEKVGNIFTASAKRKLTGTENNNLTNTT
jgi:hypothetical protein